MAMVRNPVYGPMVDHRSAEYQNVNVEGDFAQVDVILQSKDGQYLGYRFMLSRQRGNQYEGSWMTSAVSRFNIVSLKAPRYRVNLGHSLGVPPENLVPHRILGFSAERRIPSPACE